MPPIERNETYTKWEQDAITMLLLHLCALLICLYLGEMGYAEDTAPVIFVLAVFLTGFFTNGYLWSLLGSLLSVFVVNYFFTGPFSKLSFSGPGYPITFVTLFVVGILTSAMTVRSRDQQRLRTENEKERTRGNLLRAVSHDLRTPINGIQGYINMATHYPDDLALQISCRDKAAIALHTLLDIVNNVLDMSKLESSAIDLEQRSFSLSATLQEVSAVIEPQAAEFGIRYEAPTEAPLSNVRLIGSPNHLQRILCNLAGNAVKYGRSGGYVRLGSRVLSHSEGCVTVEFTCEDNGIGMSEEFQQHLFEPFAQEADDARTQYQGTGLGLSIVEKLVSAMHGTITFNSQKGVGTSFRVVLPFGIDRTAPTAPVPLPTADFTGIHILLAEDNDLNMEIAEFLLQEHGATVSRAWNGREALTLFDASAPGSFDLILMDIMMPVMDGLEAARAIRALPRPDAQTIPILAMSANAFSDDIRQSLAAGMNEHLSKPIEEGKLLTVIARLLGKDEKAAR